MRIAVSNFWRPVTTAILDDSEQYLRAREAEAKFDHVWIFEARTLSTASSATMRDVRCIPDGTKVPRTGHIDMRASGWRGHMGQAQELGRHTQRRQDVQANDAAYPSVP
jgi:hypothetical protein